MENKDWRERFDERFVEHGGVLPKHRDFGQTLCRELKSFISQVEHEAEERVIRDLYDMKSFLRSEDEDWAENGVSVDDIEDYAKSKGINLNKKQ